MAEVVNTNVFDANKKFVDFSGLDYFWTKAKTYIDDVDASMSAKVLANETAIKQIEDELDTISDGVGSVDTQIDNAIAALDLPNTYDAKGTADQALIDAKDYTDDKDFAMDARVKVLEAIDHDILAANAAASAVATVLDGAPEKFDTLKEVAEWIASSESANTTADLVTRVAALEAIDYDAYVDADDTVLADAKAYTDSKVDGKFDAIGSADAAQAAAIAQAKADAAGALADYYKKTETYSKTEVDNLLSTNSAADQAYAKTYTDELFNSITFASNSDIDALFT